MDVRWSDLLEGRVVLLGDFNTHSPERNLDSSERRDTVGLETLIEEHDLIFNNEPGRATRPMHWNTTSIIELTFHTPGIGALDMWVINEELSRQSDYKVIVFDLTRLEETVRGMVTSQEVTRWSIKDLSLDARRKAAAEWHRAAAGQPQTRERSSRDDVEEEAEGI